MERECFIPLPEMASSTHCVAAGVTLSSFKPGLNDLASNKPFLTVTIAFIKVLLLVYTC